MRSLQLIVVFLFPLILLSQENKEGKFLGIKEVHLPDYTYESFLDFPEDIQNLKNKNKRLILFVHQKNCPYCARFSEKILKKENIKKKILKNFGLVELNMFGNREVVGFDSNEYTEKEYAKILGLQFTPTLLFYDENKIKLLQLNGFINEEKFNLALDYIKDRKENELSFTEYLIKKLPIVSGKGLFKSDIFNTGLKSLGRSSDSKELAVFFERANCEACEILHSKYLSNPLIKDFLSKIDVAQIDMNYKQTLVTPKKLIGYTNDFIKSLEVSNTPTIVFFDTNGDEIIRIDSLYKMFHMQSIFDYVVSGAYKDEKEFQRYLSKRSRKIREKGIDVNIWK